MANCYFAHDSSGFPILLLFFDAQFGRSCYPVLRHNSAAAEFHTCNMLHGGPFGCC